MRSLFFGKKFHIVIVCTANRTRSAYFAGLLEHCLEQYGPGALKKIRITSAGTHAVRGGRVNDVAALIARKHGFTLRRHLSTPLSDRIVKQADLILVMEKEHKDFILQKWPEAESKVFRLMEFGWTGEDPDESLDVPDPTGKCADDFRAFDETARGEVVRVMEELSRRGIIP